jgi:hypothetical protein
VKNCSLIDGQRVLRNHAQLIEVSHGLEDFSYALARA